MWLICLLLMEGSSFMLDRMQELIASLLSDPNLRFCRVDWWRIGDFHSPLDYKGLGLKQYPAIVKYPMDLGTIQVHLALSLYF